jgi:hypothetical protein
MQKHTRTDQGQVSCKRANNETGVAHMFFVGLFIEQLIAFSQCINCMRHDATPFAFNIKVRGALGMQTAFYHFRRSVRSAQINK